MYCGLTTSKANGGIGLRELHSLNLALLAKQLWGLLEKPTSVIFNILKAKYFRHGEIMRAEVGYKPSYLWRSLMAAR